MKLSQKRTCNGCKGENGGHKPMFGKDYGYCDLKFKTNNISYWNERPLEPCLKPVTWKQWNEAVSIRRDLAV